MAAGTENVEDRLSCDDLYSERNLEVYDSGAGVNSKRNTAVSIRTRWKRSLTSLNLVEPIGRLCNSVSCSY